MLYHSNASQPPGIDFDDNTIIVNISPQMSTFALEINITTIDDNEVEEFELFAVEAESLQPMSISLVNGSSPFVTVTLMDDDGKTCSHYLHH